MKMYCKHCYALIFAEDPGLGSVHYCYSCKKKVEVFTIPYEDEDNPGEKENKIKEEDE